MCSRSQEETRMNVVPATPSDLAEIRQLLSSEGLPIEDLNEASVKHFLVLREAASVIGAVGLESHGEFVLLRSLVVARDHRSCGLGVTLVDAAELLAATRGASSIFLLTTTAANFFATRGFRIVAREEVPAQIKRTTEFASLCPATATVMAKP
jgi:amino-acid N-acetyltransferase